MGTSIDDYHRLLAEGLWKINPIVIEVGPDVTVSLSLTSETGKQAHVAFVGVRDLRLVQATANWRLSLQIMDIRDRHWEGLHFAVEGEHDELKFYCREITIQR